MSTLSPPRPSSVRERPVRRRAPYDTLKRLLDAVCAALGLLVLAPLAAVVALLILFEDGRPILFRQRRIGRDGRTFTLLKFRTMLRETPDISTEEMRATGRSFHTRIGAVLRKTSLDELPQLWNILFGQMSLVGPRPALYNQYDLIAMREDAGVNDVRPGITGWAQVNGRDDLDDATKVSYDAEYVRRCSFAVDLRILWQTFTAVVSSRGNY